MRFERKKFAIGAGFTNSYPSPVDVMFSRPSRYSTSTLSPFKQSSSVGFMSSRIAQMIASANTATPSLLNLFCVVSLPLGAQHSPMNSELNLPLQRRLREVICRQSIISRIAKPTVPWKALHEGHISSTFCAPPIPNSSRLRWVINPMYPERTIMDLNCLPYNPPFFL